MTTLDSLPDLFLPAVVETSYADTDLFRSYIRDDSSFDADLITVELASSSRAVDAYTGRHFYQHTATQYFSPALNNLWILDLDDMDLATTAGLTVDVEYGTDGTYPETRTVDVDFICEPVNQSVNGVEGWPFTSFRSISKIWPPRYAEFVRDTVKVTGTWGWPAVPSSVVHATLVLTAENFKMMDAPFGYVGFGNFGTARVQNNPKAAALLNPYRKQTTLLMA